MHEQGAASTVVAVDDHTVEGTGRERGSDDAVAAADVLREQAPGVEQRCRNGLGVQHAVAAFVIGPGPQHLGVDAAADQVQQRQAAIGSAERRLIEARADPWEIMRMCVPLAAHVQNARLPQQPRDRPGPPFVFLGLPEYDRVMRRPI